MALIHWQGGSEIERVIPSSLEDNQLKESDLRGMLARNVNLLSEGELEFFVITEEFSRWADSGRSVDILAIRRSDSDTHDLDVVIIELKRATTRDAELQAIRYASMCTALVFEDLVASHAEYLRKAGEFEPTRQARIDILNFLEMTEGSEPQVGNRPEIVLVASDFGTELTTTVLFLTSEFGMEIRCVRFNVYHHKEDLLVDFVTLIPLPQAESYRVRMREKKEQEAIASGRRQPRTSSILASAGIIAPGVVIRLIGRSNEERTTATFGDPVTGNKNVIWKEDGQAYSLSALTTKLRDELGLDLPAGSLNGYAYWSLHSESESLSARAQALTALPPNPDGYFNSITNVRED